PVSRRGKLQLEWRAWPRQQRDGGQHYSHRHLGYRHWRSTRSVELQHDQGNQDHYQQLHPPPLTKPPPPTSIHHPIPNPPNPPPNSSLPPRRKHKISAARPPIPRKKAN